MDVIEIRSQKKVEIAPQLGLRPCVPNSSLKRILIFESLWAAENARFGVEMLTDSRNYHFANRVIITQCKPPLEQRSGKSNRNKTSGPWSSAFTSFCWASSRQGRPGRDSAIIAGIVQGRLRWWIPMKYQLSRRLIPSQGSLEQGLMVTLACSGNVIANTVLGSSQTWIVCHL